jgi:hypothetical protein
MSDEQLQLTPEDDEDDFGAWVESLPLIPPTKEEEERELAEFWSGRARGSDSR